jgi:hypothetical protein
MILQGCLSGCCRATSSWRGREVKESRGRAEWGGVFVGITRLVRLGIQVFLTELVYLAPPLPLASCCISLSGSYRGIRKYGT